MQGLNQFLKKSIEFLMPKQKKIKLNTARLHYQSNQNIGSLYPQTPLPHLYLSTLPNLVLTSCLEANIIFSLAGTQGQKYRAPSENRTHQQ